MNNILYSLAAKDAKDAKDAKEKQQKDEMIEFPSFRPAKRMRAMSRNPGQLSWIAACAAMTIFEYFFVYLASSASLAAKLRISIQLRSAGYPTYGVRS